jgi:general secretion pathway protein G
MIKFMINKGFTLIELVIVMTLIGILVAVAIPQFTDLAPKARGNVDKNTVGVVRSALSLYIADNDGTHPTVSQLAAFTVPTGTVNAGTTGIQYTRDDATTHTVFTYYDVACSVPTAPADSADPPEDTVFCVSGS